MEIIKNKSKRIYYLDIARAIGIILIIIGYMNINQYIKTFIFTFHVPLFFIISGYLFKKRTLKECLKKTFKELIIPYILISILIIAAVIVKSHFYLKQENNVTNELFIKWLLASLYGCGSGIHFGINQIGAIWFLLALGISKIIYNCIYDYKHKIILILIISYIGYKTSKILFLPFSIQPGMFAIIFFYFGNLLREKNEIFDKYKIIIYILGIFSLIFCSISQKNTLSIATANVTYGLLNILGAIGGSLIIIEVSKFLENIKIIKDIFIYIGQNTEKILGFHLLALNVLTFTKIIDIFQKYLNVNSNMIVIILNLIFPIITMIIINILIYIYKKILIFCKIKNFY